MVHQKYNIAEKLKGILWKECCICGAPLLTAYLMDGYGNAACMSHASDIIYCASCSRMCGKDLNPIGSGRYVCSGCLHSIPDEQSCYQIISYVRKKLGEQGMQIPDFRIERISAEQLAFKGNPSANGLAMKQGDGYTIYVLKDLISTALAEVLAHEMTHTWQWEKRIVVKQEICEGFCNLASYIVLQSIDTEMARIKVRNLEQNPDIIYGEGFRKVKDYYDKNGMQMTIKRLEKHI